MDLVRVLADDPPGPARAQLSDLVVDPELHAALDHHSELLGGVSVLRDVRIGGELDKGERDALALDPPRADDVAPDMDRANGLDIDEVRHCFLPGRRRTRRARCALPERPIRGASGRVSGPCHLLCNPRNDPCIGQNRAVTIPFESTCRSMPTSPPMRPRRRPCPPGGSTAT